MNREDYPSAAILAELSQAVHEADPTRRAARVWRLVNRATPNSDAGIVRDFALDQGLIAPLEMGPTGRSGHAGVSWVNPSDGSEMVWIPPGPALLGRPPRRRAPVPVVLPCFSLARHPVSNTQFKRFLDETDYWPPAWHPRNDLFLARWRDRRPLGGDEDHPVTWVSYIDALSYCIWAGLTLPSEWLWEKAARGPEGWPYPWGDDPPSAAPVPLVNTGTEGTVAVGQFPRTRSVYGCEDLIGNVAEWCQLTSGDRHDHIPPPLPVIEKPDGPNEIRLACVRGSCFLRTGESRMTGWHRRRLSQTRRNQWVGFRPACLLAYRPVVPA